MARRCSTCAFWEEAATIEGHTGLCRRYPMPQPVTPPDHWCGEYREIVQGAASTPPKETQA